VPHKFIMCRNIISITVRLWLAEQMHNQFILIK